MTTYADYLRRAEQHRPRDEEALRAAAIDLCRRGLTDRDISAALRIPLAAVKQLLGEVPA
jgi:DNA-directed RNA polymerase specialized sigma24 family protein